MPHGVGTFFLLPQRQVDKVDQGLYKLKHSGKVNLPQLKILKLFRAWNFFKKHSFLQSTDPIKMQITLRKNSILCSPHLVRLQLQLVISRYFESLQHNEIIRVLGLQVTRESSWRSKHTAKRRRKGRIINFIAVPRAGPQGKDLSACYISLGYYL